MSATRWRGAFYTAFRVGDRVWSKIDPRWDGTVKGCIGEVATVVWDRSGWISEEHKRDLMREGETLNEDEERRKRRAA
jgi:hypothetical protein